MFDIPFLDLPALASAAGTVTLPGSKSISNRVLLLAALCEGSTTVHDLLDSDDTRVMLTALRALGCHEGTHRLILEALRFVRFDQVWLPQGESYVALGLDGPGVAWVGKGYVFVKATGAFVELPGYRASRGGGSPLDVHWGATCERHFVARSLTGVCDQCTD